MEWKRCSQDIIARMAAPIQEIIPISDYSSEILGDYLKKIFEVDRKIAIGFKNYTNVSGQHSGRQYYSTIPRLQ